MGLKVLIMGDSFIANFKTFLKDHQEEFSYSLNLPLSQVMVQYSSLRGGNVEKLQTYRLEDVEDFEPDIVLLQIGSNDLCDMNSTPESVAKSIIDLADKFVSSYNVKFVAVMQIFHRLKPTRPVRYRIDPAWYNPRVDTANRTLSDLADPNHSCLWRHKGFWEPSTQEKVFDTDGTHLTFSGNVRFFQSLRALTVHLLKQF